MSSHKNFSALSRETREKYDQLCEAIRTITDTLDCLKKERAFFLEKLSELDLQIAEAHKRLEIVVEESFAFMRKELYPDIGE